MPRGLLTVDQAVQETFGLLPNQDRLNVLPRYSRKDGWVAPDMVYQLAKMAVTPGVAAKGGLISQDDSMNFGMSLLGSGLGASAVKPVGGRGILGSTVFHGSPHDFDRFSMSRIGTGEGAQAYGHGLYVAENPNVAKSYAVSRSASQPRFYTVDLPDEHINKMLDWDAPLSDEMVARLSEAGFPVTAIARGKMGNGGDFYKALGNPEKASESLRSLGIPGIKYLDGASRAAGQGSRNFVVFDEGLVKILGKE
jgi:hypothetical protein